MQPVPALFLQTAGIAAASPSLGRARHQLAGPPRLQQAHRLMSWQGSALQGHTLPTLT
jgi:hypothetical protein